MAGSGGEVLVGQFFKDGSSSEIRMLKQLPGITVKHCTTVPGRWRNLTPEQREQARRDYTAYLRELLALAEGKDLLVLDEAVSACNNGVIPEGALLDFVRGHAFSMEIVQNLLTNFLAKPDFVAYSHKGAGNPARQICRYLYRNLSVAWTIRSEQELKEAEKKFDLFIFEGFRPDPDSASGRSL